MTEEVVDTTAADAEAAAENERRLTEKKAAVEERRKKKKEMLIQIQDVLFEHNGLESNIPINHGYWDTLNAFKALHLEADEEFIREQEAKAAAAGV